MAPWRQLLWGSVAGSTLLARTLGVVCRLSEYTSFSR